MIFVVALADGEMLGIAGLISAAVYLSIRAICEAWLYSRGHVKPDDPDDDDEGS